MTHVVIVGNGPAGHRLAERLAAADAPVTVTVLGAEAHPAYNRVLLTSVLSGALPPESTRLAEPPDGVAVHTGVSAVEIDRAHRVVRTDDGVLHRYDRLVLATGASATLPPIEGLLGPDGGPADGVSAFRTLDDCRRILALAGPGRRAVVVGGGVLGLEAARGLGERGAEVSLVHAARHLMDRQLDRLGGRALSTVLTRLGVRLLLGQQTVGYTPGKVSLTDGTVLPADLVVVSTGATPNVELARRAGLTTRRGIVVDDRLRTDDPAIHAIGDCAEHAGSVSGLIAPAWEQADLLAESLTGRSSAAYLGSATVTRLKARDIDLAALGDSATSDDTVDDDVEVVTMADPAQGRCARITLRDDRIVGAYLVGCPDAVGPITQLYDAAAAVPGDRLALLLGGAPQSTATDSPSLLPDRAVICRCNSVTKRALITAWQAGARDLPSLTTATRAGSGCGGCSSVVEGICDWLRASDPDQEARSDEDAAELSEVEGAA